MGTPGTSLPFVGPRPFTEDHHAVFFGRERTLRDLGRLLVAERIVLLYSPSGAGKTSLLRAGLIPALIDEKFTVRPVMRVNSAPPDEYSGTLNRFLLSAMLELHKAFPESERDAANPANMGDITFTAYLDQLAGPEAGSFDEVRIFDQFEEILKIEPGSRAAHRDRIEFFRQVGEALASRRRWAVFSIREDYLAGLDPYRRSIPTRLTTRFRLDTLRVEEARRAIALPPHVPEFNVTITDDAVDQLLANLGRRTAPGDETATGPSEIDDAMYIEPLHLQVVCDRLWRDVQPAPGDTITVEDVHTHGDVDRALGTFYAEGIGRVAALVAQEFPKTDEHAIRDWFEHELIIGDERIRGQVAQGDSTSGTLPNAVAAELDNEGLIRGETRLNTLWWELSHDRMIGPVQASNANWFEKNLTDVQKQARQWEHADHPDWLLLGVRDWLGAREWASARGDRLKEHERTFLKKSGDKVRRLAQMTGVVLGAIAVAIAIGFGIVSWLDDGDELRHSRELASQATLNLPGDHATSLEWALLYAVAAIDIVGQEEPPPEAQTSLLSSLVARPGYVGPLVVPDGPIPDPADQSSSASPLGPVGNLPDTLATSRDGRTVASVDDAGVVTIIQAPALPMVGTAVARPTPHTFSLAPDRGDVVALALFDNAGYEDGLLVVGRRDGTLELWDIRKGLQVDVPFADRLSNRPPTVELTSLDSNPFGFVAAGFTDGTITIWSIQNLTAPTALQTLSLPGRDRTQVTALAFEPWLPTSFRDQASIADKLVTWRVIAGYSNGSVWTWAGVLAGEPTSNHLAELPSGTPVLAIAPNQRSGWLAFGGEDGFVILQDSAPLIPLTATPTVTALAFDPLQPHALLTGHMDGQVWRWTFATDVISMSITNTSTRLGESTGSPVTGLATVPHGHWAISTSGGTTTPALWNALGLPSIAYAVNDRFTGLPACSVDLAFSDDAASLVIQGEGGEAVEWPLDQKDPDAAATSVPASPALTPRSTLRAESVTCEKQDSFGTGRADTTIPIVDRHGNIWMSNVHDALGERASDPGVIVTSIINDDRTLIATGHASGVIRLWTLVEEEWWRLGDLPGHSHAITALTMSGIGQPYLASLDANGLVVIWDLDPDRWISHACSRAGYGFDSGAGERMSGLSKDDLEELEQRHPCNEHQDDSAHIQPEATNRRAMRDQSYQSRR